MTQEHNFTQGKIMALLMKFAVPVMLAMFLQDLLVNISFLVILAIVNSMG